MLSYMVDYLKPPRLVHDLEESRKAKFNHYSLLFITGGSFFLGIQNMTGETHLDIVLFALAVISLLFVIINKRGHFTITSLLIAGLILVVITFSLIDGVGLKDAGLIAYPIFIVYTSFLFSMRGSIISTLLSVASVFYVYHLTQTGRLEPPGFSNTSQLKVIIILLVTMGSFFWVIMDDWERMINALRREVEDRKIAQQNLYTLNQELEKRVHQRTMQLEAANKELEAFSYSVSHDLRAPLRAIDGFSQMLVKDYSSQLDGQGKEYLNNIRTASQRMKMLINDLLKLSRITRDEMHLQHVDISAIVNEIAVELSQKQPEREVEFRIASGLKASVDERLLRIALNNLLGNAWKFTSKEKEAVIEFGLTEVDQQSMYFVRDNGTGFDMTYAEKLFAPFQRLHSSEYDGTGIGLTTVQRIIQRHGGRIWAQAEQDLGATFYFTLGQEND